MTRAGRAGTAGAVLLVSALVQACSAFAPTRTTAPVEASWPGCEAVGAFVADRRQGPTGVGGVPPGFTPTSVVLCQEGERPSADGDTVSVDLERTSTEVGPLLTYLAQPSERPSGGPCTADAWLPPWLFLVDASGRCQGRRAQGPYRNSWYGPCRRAARLVRRPTSGRPCC
jgi:hypothetical protein